MVSVCILLYAALANCSSGLLSDALVAIAANAAQETSSPCGLRRQITVPVVVVVIYNIVFY